MIVNIFNQSLEATWNRYRQDYHVIAMNTASKLDLSQAFEISVIFVNATQIQKINKQYRNIDLATDVLSFAIRDREDDFRQIEKDLELGDIFINVQAIRKQAKTYQHTLRREACFLFTHGLLHLLGYDHQNKTDEKIMFTLQERILSHVVPKKSYI